MATIDSRDIIDEIIAKKGVVYPDDPSESPVVRVVEYTNAWGKVTWGVVFANEHYRERYNQPSNYVINPKTIWDADEEAANG